MKSTCERLAGAPSARYGVADPQAVGHADAVGGRIIVGVPPCKSFHRPFFPGFPDIVRQPCSCECDFMLHDPFGVVGLRMFFHTVDRAVAVLVVLPCHLITRLGWADIGDFVIADRFGVVVFAAPQFVPRIVGRSVPVGVLRHPHDARFGRRVELVAFDVEVVSARVGHGFREGRHDAASPAAERNPVIRSDAVRSIAACVCRRCHMVESGHRAVDELARCRGVFEDRGDGLLNLCGRGLFAGIAGGEKKRRERECIFFHVFHNFLRFRPGFGPGISRACRRPGSCPSPGIFSAPEGGGCPQLHRSPGVRSAAGWHGAASGCRFACLSRTGQK